MAGSQERWDLPLSQDCVLSFRGEADPSLSTEGGQRRVTPSTLVGADILSTFRKTAVISANPLIFSKGERVRLGVATLQTSVAGGPCTVVGCVTGL